MNWRARPLALLAAVAVTVALAGCGLGSNRRRLATDKPGKGSITQGLNWQCGLLGGGLGALAGAGLSFGGTALVNDEWPIDSSVEWAETFPIWGTAIIFGATIGLLVACLGED